MFKTSLHFYLLNLIFNDILAVKIFPNSQKVERLVSGVCVLKQQRTGVWRNKNVGEGLSWQPELSTETCSVALPTGKGHIIMELNNCWENTSFYHPQEAKMVNASF